MSRIPILSVPHSMILIQNLDVNQAVNNLLSRDDDDGDIEGGEGESLIPAAFFPSGGRCGHMCSVIDCLSATDELLSLLGSVGGVGGAEEEMEGGCGLQGRRGLEERRG